MSIHNLINIRRGEGGRVGKGGPLWLPAMDHWKCWLVDERAVYPSSRATIKAHPTSTRPLSPLQLMPNLGIPCGCRLLFYMKCRGTPCGCPVPLLKGSQQYE